MKRISYEHGGPGISGGKAGSGRYRSFAHLAADWIWELDANLCYTFHDGKSISLSGETGESLVGQSRIETLTNSLPASEELTEHNRLLQQGESIDIIIPLGQHSQIKYAHIIAQSLFDDQGRLLGYRGCGRDVTSRVELEARLAHLATHDDLTGVLNRREFKRKLSELHAQAKTSKKTYSLCFIDLDRFKHVNDNGGHHAGDQLLRELVVVIRKHVQPGETIARLGGDEFGLLLRSDSKSAVKVTEKIVDAISRYAFLWEGTTYRVGASIGIAQINGLDESVEKLMVKADNACYAAKHNGRNQSYISDEQLAIESVDVSRVSAIRRALENEQYKLLMQPIVSINHEEPFTRFELLLRLSCDNGELLEPATFMPLAKQYSLMQKLDCWVFENALNALAALHRGGDDVALSINLSASSLADTAALNRIAALFVRFKLPQHRVCIDIAETAAIRNIEAVSEFITQLKGIGVEFALDDFGNGLSSFAYLQHLPIDYLKIDGDLIRQLSTNQTVRCITASFHELSVKLGIRTVAESVEDAVAVSHVKAIGIDYMQGFGVADLAELAVLTDLRA